MTAQGILLVNKPKGKTSFSLVGALRKILKVKKIGHAGTLDPLATGVMVMLIGREATRLSNTFLESDKEYCAEIRLGISTDTYDAEGQVVQQSELVPSDEAIKQVLSQFQGEIEQVPPMFSAKKHQGKKLYEIARKGNTVERLPVKVRVKTTFIDYHYPYLNLIVACSKGTYIRSIAQEIGERLGCGAHLSGLQRTRSGTFELRDCFDGERLFTPGLGLEELQERIVQLVDNGRSGQS